MKTTTKAMAVEIAEEMSSAVKGVLIKRKMKQRIYEIAKKIAKKSVRGKQRSEMIAKETAIKNPKVAVASSKIA